MIETDFMQLYEELSELNEVKEITSFDNGSDTAFYHFYEDLSDLINSLKVKRIYSNKNVHESQLDVFAPKDTSYVCMTVGSEGKKRTTQNFGTRSFGISFKDLPGLCERNPAYSFDPGETGVYSQFLAKTQYNIGQQGIPTQSSKDNKVTAFRDFELLAIGKLSTGEYFISGGQGRNLNNHWSSKTFTDDKVYGTLRAWFLTNMDAKRLEQNPDTAQPHIFYHLKDIKEKKEVHIPRHPEDIFINGDKQHILNSVKQHNPNYRPRPDSAGSDSFKRAIDFSSFHMAAGIECEEIIGVGPFRVTDETGHTILQLDMCSPGDKGGYQPPKLFSAIADTLEAEETKSDKKKSAYADIDDYTPGQSMQLQTVPEYKSRPYHLLLAKDTAEFIADLYNESEHRVYISDKKDLVFNPTDIESIILPAKIKTYSNREYDIEKLLRAAVYGVLDDYNDKHSFIQALKAVDVVKSGTRAMTELVYNNLTMLIQLLFTEYDHAIVELLDYDGRSVSTLNLHTEYANKGGIDKLTQNNETGKYANTNAGAHMRFIPEDDILNFNIMSQIENPEIVDWNGVDSVIADIKVLGNKARLGAEVIVVGEDSLGEQYVLFVDNAYKSKVFLELPGGGLHDTNISSKAFENIALQRLKFKCNINPADLDGGLTDTGKGLLLSEKSDNEEGGTKGVAKSDSVKWNWSYYKLYTARYNKVIDVENTDYSIDNTNMVIQKARGEEGYVSYLKWIPVDSLNYNRALLTRYSNVFPIIKSLAKAVN